MSIAGVNVNGRSPPHDLDSEAALISATLIGGRSTVDECDGLVSPRDAYSEAHRWILEAAFAIAQAGDPVDMVTVAMWLKAKRWVDDETGREGTRIEQVGGMAYLTEVINSAPHVANVGAYAKRVRDLRLVRDAITRMQQRIAEGYTGVTDVRKFLDGAEQDMAELSGARETKTVDFEHIDTTLREVYKELDDLAKSKSTVAGMPSGFERYDRIVSGLHDGDLTIVAARPGMGKTSFVMAVGANVADTKVAVIEQRYVPDAIGDLRQGVAVFSCEMPRKQLVARTLAAHARVDLQAMRTPMTLSPAAWGKLQDGCKDLSKLPLYVDDSPGVSLRQAATKLRRLRRNLQKRGKDLRLAIFDYLQLMNGPGDSREQEISGLSRGLKNLAKELGIPIIALAQLNRKCEERSDKRPLISDLRESGAIEQDADNIVFIYRDAYYNRDSLERGTTELIVAKQRNGPTGKVRVQFENWCARFENAPDSVTEDD